MGFEISTRLVTSSPKVTCRSSCAEFAQSEGEQEPSCCWMFGAPENRHDG